MADDIVIRAEGLGKKYVIGHAAERESYVALRDVLARGVRSALRKAADMAKGRIVVPGETVEEFWALKDIDFEVKRGEVLGIIGQNGAGKSTLLKILSRITEPSEGRVTINGRVASLLEVGTGFHPELTGRENIYLNGAILGMTRSEIKRKFDAIVDFSGVEKFLDTPVKRYSSGMYVRLAFAVAAHLEPEILVVDEVLAVGDAEFQKKCLGKMQDVAGHGRTVLFVSHNLVAVNSFCTRAICLHEGRVVLQGRPGSVSASYLKHWLPALQQVTYDDITTAPGNELIRVRRARVRPQHGTPEDAITVRTPVVVEFEYWKLSARAGLDLVVGLFNEQGINVFTTASLREPSAPAGLVRSSFFVPGDLLNNGTYRIHLTLFLDGLTSNGHWEDLVAFEVQDEASELRAHYHDEWNGVVRPNLVWKTELLEALPAPVARLEP